MDHPNRHRDRSVGAAEAPIDVDATESGVDTAPSPEASLGLADVAFLLAVPLVLVGVFVLPKPVRLSLALSYLEPTVLTAYASHFVHLEFPHLLANLLVFLAVVPFAVLASVKSGRRHRFYLVAFVFLTVFPFVFSGLNVLFPRPRIGFGFSGISLAFVGYLPHALADRLERDGSASAAVASSLLPAAFFAGTILIALRMWRSLGAAPPAARAPLVAAGLGSLLSMLIFARPVYVRIRDRDESLSALCPPSVAFGALLFVLVVLVGFPNVSPADGTVLNLFVHFLGYSFGFVVPYATFRVVGFD